MQNFVEDKHQDLQTPVNTEEKRIRMFDWQFNSCFLCFKTDKGTVKKKKDLMLTSVLLLTVPVRDLEALFAAHRERTFQKKGGGPLSNISKLSLRQAEHEHFKVIHIWCKGRPSRQQERENVSLLRPPAQ